MLINMLKNRWTESIAISLSFPVIGYAIDPADPFFINYEFPWLILAPVLAGLRYGFVAGITSATLLISLVTGGFFLGWPGVSFFPEENEAAIMAAQIKKGRTKNISFFIQ